MRTNELETMTDTALVVETKRAAAEERTVTAHLIRLLMEMERRGLHLSMGYSSMFAYCTRALGLSEQAAYGRIAAARAARRFSGILDRLTTGTLTLTSVGLLAPHLTQENVDAVISAAEGRSTREIERLIATMHPQPDIPSSVRAAPVRQPRFTEAPAIAKTVRAASTVSTAEASEPIQPGVFSAPSPSVIAPLTPERFFLKVTISKDAHARLERLQCLLRHAIPDGDPAKIIDRALVVLLTEAERTRFAQTARPRTAGGQSGLPASRHVPAATRRAVWNRDGGRCAFVGADGRCTEIGFLEFHHVIPFGAGGATDARNLELRCRAHNAHEARLYFGATEEVGPSV